MKRNAVVLSVLLVITALSTQAQGVHVGIKAGANLFKVDGQSFSNEFKFGYNAGAFAQIYFDKQWGIQPELMFNQTNYRTGTDFSSIYPTGLNDFKGKLNYLTMPLLLSYRPVPVLSILAGPQFGILLNQDEHLVNNGKDAFKKGDFSLVGGAQVNIANFMAGARYVIGLNDINDVTSDHKWKNQGWQLYAGFRIF
ncbi:MAG: PorT family protein [Bacteroidetes bacterium]|nr:PorT family protein [Bacteroidota bacterium]